LQFASGYDILPMLKVRIVVEEWVDPLFLCVNCAECAQEVLLAGKQTGVAARVTEIARPAAESLGLVLWDVVHVKEGPGWFLRIFIDKEGGVGTDDCEKMSRAVDGPIEEIYPADQEWTLEVSSPGLGRALRTDAHLGAFTGKAVRARFYRPDAEGRRERSGTLLGFTDKTLAIEIDGQETEIARSDLSGLFADDDRDLFLRR